MPRSRARLKILLTEGSSLSARQTLYALGRGYVIDVCDPKPWRCLARYSRFVRTCYRCPPFAVDPFGYLQFLRDRVRAERYDVLLPIHDQVYLLSRFREEFAHWTAVPVPDFSALERLQSKSAFVDLLRELTLPQPATTKVRSRQELEQIRPFPFYVKLPYSTAGRGVWLVENPHMLKEVADGLQAAGALDGHSDVLAQQPAPGILCVAQSVFQDGRLLAAHTYQALALGVGGSARARVSVSHPLVLEHLRGLGAKLRWHGALMLDYLYDPATRQVAYIEANPRIGETVNALLSGPNLCQLLVRVALGEHIEPHPPSRPETKTHSLMMGLLDLAKRGSGRRDLLAELWRALRGQDVYAGSQDELTRPGQDALSLVPALFLTLQLLANPRAAQRIVDRAVNDYALSEAGAVAIRKAAEKTPH